MSMSATHTSGFNTGSDNQNKWLLYPLYSACQHSPLKGAGGGDGRALGSDVASLGQEGGAGPSAYVHGLRAARVNICFAGLGRGGSAACRRRRPWRPSFSFPRGRVSGQAASRRADLFRAHSCKRLSCLAWLARWPRPGIRGLLDLPSLPSLPRLFPGLPGFADLLGGLELGSFLLQLLCPWVGGQSADLQGGERAPNWA